MDQDEIYITTYLVQRLHATGPGKSGWPCFLNKQWKCLLMNCILSREHSNEQASPNLLSTIFLVSESDIHGD